MKPGLEAKALKGVPTSRGPATVFIPERVSYELIP